MKIALPARTAAVASRPTPGSEQYRGATSMPLPRITVAGVTGALPTIDIAVRELPRQFLERMAKIAESSGSFTVERCYDVLGMLGFHVLNLRYLRETEHEEFGGQLIAREESKKRIAVEMRAKRWTPDPPTYDCYSSSARSTIGPLLAGYNREHRTRYRLRIQPCFHAR